MEYYYEPASVTCASGLYTDFPALLASTSVSTIAYALHLAIGGAAVLFLLNQGRRKSPNRLRHLLFITTLLILGTFNISLYLVSVTICQRRAVEGANFERYRESRCTEINDLLRSNGLEELACSEDETAGFQPIIISAGLDLTRGLDVTGLLIGILAQGYLLFRCHLLVGRRLVTGLMGLLYVATTAFGITNIIFLPGGAWKTASSTPTPAPRTLHTHIAYIYFALCLLFNVLANILIVSRLFLLRARLRNALGKEHGKMYAGVMAMLLESSMVYSGVLVVGFAALPGDGGAESLFHPLVAQSEALAAELIILRFAIGRSLSRDDVVSVTKPKPNHDPNNSDAELMRENERVGGMGIMGVVSRGLGLTRFASREDHVTQDTLEIGRLANVPVAKTTFSEFPSSVAAVLNSQRGGESSDQTGTR
ncbi:hypothetical protein BDV98DRAFT_607980 [Pterulicium gracile]|uniref:Uncharacterized protein n=1 Tax=Pterulicium gracile TaxID=1884261 RepID=A0A5C3Q4N8_9AGAR|nr:hypothetical protein BDV98DRAFT_607980 [Pterula gracilis]